MVDKEEEADSANQDQAKAEVLDSAPIDDAPQSLEPATSDTNLSGNEGPQAAAKDKKSKSRAIKYSRYFYILPGCVTLEAPVRRSIINSFCIL